MKVATPQRVSRRACRVDAVLHRDFLLRNARVRDRVKILWNANNAFSFDRIAWGRLASAAVITTVSYKITKK